jgi:glycerophosphoryl diester phosphodiesterase
MKALMEHIWLFIIYYHIVPVSSYAWINRFRNIANQVILSSARLADPPNQYSAMASAPIEINEWPYPRYIAHRGGGILAPENTLEAIKVAPKYGFQGVEFDVMLSKDFVPHLMHDTTIGRTVTNERVRGWSFDSVDSDEIAEFNAGQWFGEGYTETKVPRFDSVLDLCHKNKIFMNIEIKPVPGVEATTGAVVGAITAKYFPTMGCENCPLFSSFSYDALMAAKATAPHIPRGFLLRKLTDYPDWKERMHKLEAKYVHIDQQHLTEEDILAIKAEGFGILCYTVNDEDRAETLIAQGVDAVCTDRLDVFSKYCSADY